MVHVPYWDKSRIWYALLSQWEISFFVLPCLVVMKKWNSLFLDGWRTEVWIAAEVPKQARSWMELSQRGHALVW